MADTGSEKDLLLTGKGPGVLVVHAWWGLNPFFRDLCKRLTDEGFTVAAPDLYHGKTASTIEEAKKLRGTLKGPIVQRELLAAVDTLKASCSSQTVGVLGFSLGGYWALWLTMQPKLPIGTAVIFYGARNGDYSASQAAFQFHFAEKDDYVSASAVKGQMKNLKTATRPAEYYTYPGTTHWFFESDRSDAFNAQAASLAWERTINFLKHS